MRETSGYDSSQFVKSDPFRIVQADGQQTAIQIKICP